jgi:hypothetical protein
MLSNELSEIGAGRLAIISGGFGPQCTIEGLLITQRTLHVRGDPALSYTIPVESTKQLGLLEHVDRFSGTDLKGETLGFRLEGCRCVHSVSLIALMIGVVMCTYTFTVINTPSYVSYRTSLVYLLDSRFMTIMIAVN